MALRRTGPTVGCRRAVTAVCAVLAATFALCVALAPTGQAKSLGVRTGALCPDTHAGYRCMAEVAAAGSGPGGALSPQDLRSVYGLASAPSTTTTVAVVDAYWAPKVASQLNGYCTTFGLGCSSGQLKVMNQGGAEIWPVREGALPPRQPADSSDPNGAGWADETAMDVQMVAAVCPTCHIVLVSANSDDRGSGSARDLETAVQTAAKNANYVSMSWGTDESRSVDGYDQSVLGRAGVIYTAAAGDWAGDLPIWPAVSPRAVAVGGTRLVRTASGWAETAWSDGGSACATYEGQPAWQRVQGAVTSACGKRATADVAVVGDPATGVAVCLELDSTTGRCSLWARVGGTSVGAPLVAAMYALAGNSTQPFAPYAHGADMRDIVSGSNAVPGATCGLICTARAGWDGPTGLGSPRSWTAFTTGLVLRNPGPVAAWKGSAVNWDLSSSGIGGPATTSYLAVAGSQLPPGTSFNPATGHVTGRPSAIGSGYFTVTTADRLSSTRLRWVVQNKVTIAKIPKRTRAVGTRVVPFSVRATDTTPGLALTYRATHLPAGVKLNKATGRFTGTLKKVGAYHVVVTVRDSTGGAGTMRFTWQVDHRFVRMSPTSISGARSVGSTLTAVTPTLRRDSKSGPIVTATYHFQWYIDGKLIKSATHRSLAVRQSFRGHSISVRYWAVRPGYSTYSKTISARIT